MKYKICQDIEKALDQKIESSSEFEMLADKIQQSTKIYISPTTLKRMWGYLKEDVNPRKATLNILARFLGYKNYDVYQKQGNNSQSSFVAGKSISSLEMPAGQLLRLIWAPNRLCIIKHLGQGNFTVIDTSNTKLMPGDTFSAHLFLENEPMYLDNLCRDGVNLGCYVAGKRDGIKFILLDDSAASTLSNPGATPL